MGDFNIILDRCERSMGSSSISAGMEDLRSCLFKAEVSDIRMSGLQYTWNKSPGNPKGLLKKLDRVMSNGAFLDKFPNANAHFLPFVVSDHTPAVINLPGISGAKPKPFKLKLLKKPLRKLKFVQGDLAANTKKFKDDLCRVQSEMVMDPSSIKLRNDEIAALNAYKAAAKDEELFLKQRSKITWLSEGDFNTKFFHNVMKERRNWNRIDNVEDMEGNFFSGKDVGEYMDDDKALGPDGFSAKFFKSSWSIVGPEFTKAIHDFFLNGINRKIKENDDFKFHWRCSKVNLTHLSFADDLMIFSNGDVGSVNILKAALNEFSGVSGLFPNLEKSQVFFGNVPAHSKAAILDIMPFSVGSLLIRYLGVPLISSRLYKKHCDPLLDKVKSRLQNWKNKSLSFAGRFQLIQSVICSIQVFWSSIFILPDYVSKEIEKLMRGFIWSQGDLKKGKAKVKWEDVCGLKIQGGLGIKSLHCWNIALMSKHLWNIASKKDSLWVQWINAYRLYDKGVGERNVWDVPIGNDVCWGWKKILQCRDVSHIVTRLGDGCDTSLWFDHWCFLGPLCQFISKRDIFEAGLSLKCKVADLLVNGEWRWPSGLSDKFPFLYHLLLFCFMIERIKFFGGLILAIDYIIARPMGNSIWSIIQRLVIGAAVYFIWQERNLRIFQSKVRSVESLCCVIKDHVRFRLLSLKVKRSCQSYDVGLYGDGKGIVDVCFLKDPGIVMYSIVIEDHEMMGWNEVILKSLFLLNGGLFSIKVWCTMFSSRCSNWYLILRRFYPQKTSLKGALVSTATSIAYQLLDKCRGLHCPVKIRDVVDKNGKYAARDRRTEFSEAKNKRVQRESVAATAERRMMRRLAKVEKLKQRDEGAPKKGFGKRATKKAKQPKETKAEDKKAAKRNKNK
ncbi:RNA-directed DNA polymerase, eukaryota, reverse transcriptase zinc-binding domain protein [Tanacetum coccineum]